MDQSNNKNNFFHLPEIVKSIVIILFSGVFAYKLITTPINIAMDFYALLSLVLALFSVGLSVLFYFKATDTSNAFYDNTYKFTKDIAELLVRIESGFGERLRHLDENYTRIQDRVYAQGSNEEIEKKQEQVKEEEQKKLQERDKLIEELLQKSQLDSQKKEDFLNQLKQREEELLSLRNQLTMLGEKSDNVRTAKLEFIHTYLMRKMRQTFPATKRVGGNGINAQKITEIWRGLLPDLSDEFLRDFQELGYVDSKMHLTDSGIELIRNIPESSFVIVPN